MSDFGLFLVMCAGLLLLLGLLRFLAWLTELQNEHGSLGRAGLNTVKKYVVARPRVMSQPTHDVLPSIPSAVQTDDRQTTDRPAPAVPPRDVMLNSHKLLRKYGIPREEARAMYKSLGLPLDNNLWTEAAPTAPADDAGHVTPIVGRPTSARFDVTDLDYPYQKPA